MKPVLLKLESHVNIDRVTLIFFVRTGFLSDLNLLNLAIKNQLLQDS